MDEEAYRRGYEPLTKLHPPGVELLTAALGEMAPELVRIIIETYGNIYARSQLDLRSRELATVAALTAMGNAAPQLKVHIQYALNAGCTEQELVEVMIQMGYYGGFPSAINALALAREVFAERTA